MPKIEITIPQGLHDFLEALSQFTNTDIQAYAEENLICSIQADLEDLEGSPCWDSKTLKTKYQADRWHQQLAEEKRQSRGEASASQPTGAGKQPAD